MKTKQVFALLAAFVLLAVPFAVSAAPPDAPSGQYYVNDFAGVLENDVEQELVRLGTALQQKNGVEIVLVTVDFTDGVPIDEYAMTLFNNWTIGEAGVDRGLLILMAIGDDDYWVTQGKGLEQTLPSGDIAEILAEYLEPDFAAKDYTAGARSVYTVFVERLGGEGLADAPQQSTDLGNPANDNTYVSNAAGVISQQTADEIERLGDYSTGEMGGAFFVAAVNNTGRQSIDDYAYDLFDRHTGMGARDVLLVMSIEDDDYYMQYGNDLKKAFTDRVIDDIFDEYTEPPFAIGDYDGAVLMTAQAVQRKLIDYGAEKKWMTPAPSNDRVTASGSGGGMVAGVIGFGIVSLLFPFILIAVIFSIIISVFRRAHYRGLYGVPYNPYSRRYVRRYGPGGYWGPRPFFWGVFHRRPPPPSGGGPGGMPPPTAGGSGMGRGGGSASRGGFWGGGQSGGTSGSSGAGRGSRGASSSGGFFGGSGLGGSTRGGGAGRSSTGGFRSSGGGRSFGGGSRGGGGGSRGGGAGCGR